MSDEQGQNRFDSEAWMKEAIERDRVRGEKAIDALKDMMSKMQAAGIYGRIQFTFQGAGDSGDIEEPYDLADNIKDFLTKSNFVIDISNSYEITEDGSCKLKQRSPDSVYVFDFLYDVLEKVLPGWEINEGSDGYIDLNFEQEGQQQVSVSLSEHSSIDHTFEF